jgi:hypothetical protein
VSFTSALVDGLALLLAEQGLDAYRPDGGYTAGETAARSRTSRGWRSRSFPGRQKRLASTRGTQRARRAPQRSSRSVLAASRHKEVQLTGYVTWNSSEPPPGFEPETYALRVCT